MSEEKNFVIVGEDIDLLVILTQLAFKNPQVFFLKPGRGKVPQKIFNSNSFKYKSLINYVGFLHCFTGCDTTSCFYKQGKNKLIKKLQDDSNLQFLIKIFYEANAEPLTIAENAIKFIAIKL